MKVFVSALLLLLYSVTAINGKCVPRKYDQDSVVCVCDESNCENLGEVSRPNGKAAVIYETSMDGARFERTEESFQEASVNLLKSSARVLEAKPPRRDAQKVFGFGGSFTDAAGINIAKLPQGLQDTLMKGYFSSEGLNYNMARVPIAGSDFSTRPYSYDDNKDDFDLEHFALAEEDIKYKIPFIKKAQSLRSEKIYLVASPWAPPAWMKVNNDVRNGGVLKGEPGTKYYKTWANYFVKFLNAYKEQGIDIWGMTVENEPLAGYWDNNFRWNCLGFNGTMERDFVKMDLGPALVNGGYQNVKLMIHDDQRPSIKEFIDPILQDPEAAKYVSGAAVHWYADGEKGPEIFDEVKDTYPDKFILATEACNYPVRLGNWWFAENYAHSIITNLQHSVSGWIDWNLALDPQGGPNWASNFVDSPVIINETAKEYYMQPMYYIMAHFSKFIPRDSVPSVWENTDGLEVVSLQRPDKGVVFVLLNKNEREMDFTITDPSNGYIDVKMAKKSIKTILYYQ